MKSLTHDVFSLGAALYIVLRLIGSPSLFDLLMVFWMAFATNELIDVLGHIRRDGRPVRSFWTHSVFTAPVWGFALGAASTYVYDGAVGQAVGLEQVAFTGGLGVVVAFSHLLLDSLTEGGVFMGRKRVALAHVGYDNRILNGTFTAVGVVLIVVALTGI